MSEDRIRAHFHSQADACERLGSPFTAKLCRILGRDLDASTTTGAKVLGWPGDPASDALALRLAGGLHALTLRGDVELSMAYPPNDIPAGNFAKAIFDGLRRHDVFLAAFIEQPPQTNEVARSAMLLPGFLAVARETLRPLQLCEIGSSAGLNLNFDRFHYSYGDAAWGDRPSPVQLAPDIHGVRPPLEGKLDITGRAGCDISPIDLSDETQCLRLRSYIWPDQPLRKARIEAAIDIASAGKMQIETVDAAEFVRRQIAKREQGATFVLFHSIMWQYMPEATSAAILAMMDDVGNSADAPVAHLRMEPLGGPGTFATLLLTLWPGGKTRQLARCDFHGRWIEWIG